MATLIRPSDTTINVQDANVREAYVRGHDLVANYSADRNWPYRAQIYWTATSDGQTGHVIATLSLTVSIETDLLAAHPEIQISTELPASETRWLKCPDHSAPSLESIRDTITGPRADRSERVAGLLFRFEKLGLSYVEMTHPSDFQRLTVRKLDANRWCSQWQLFGQFLEKGVIRRARVQGLWVDREQDVEAAVRAYREFAHSEIPLSA